VIFAVTVQDSNCNSEVSVLQELCEFRSSYGVEN